MAKARSPKCEHCKQTIRAPRQPKEKPLPAVVDPEWLASGATPGERWDRHLAALRPGGIEAWEQARKFEQEVLAGARELFGPYATFGNGSGPCWVGAMTPLKGCVRIGFGPTLPDALEEARSRVESGVVLVKQIERYTSDLFFGGVEVEWPKGQPGIPDFGGEETEKGESDDVRLWAEEQIVKTCLTFEETQRVLDRFMASRKYLDESAVMDEPEDLDPAEAFHRESEDDDEPREEPGEEATPEEETPVIPDENMETYGQADVEAVYSELVPV